MTAHNTHSVEFQPVPLSWSLWLARGIPWDYGAWEADLFLGGIEKKKCQETYNKHIILEQNRVNKTNSIDIFSKKT